MKKELEYLYEINLPEYLQKDLDAVKNNSFETCTYYDCLLNELESSINCAMYSEHITKEHAQYLRDKFLYL